MTNVIIGIVTTVIFSLIGAVYLLLNKRTDGKVDRAWCEPSHHAIAEGVKEIKADIRDIKVEQRESAIGIARIEEQLLKINQAGRT